MKNFRFDINLYFHKFGIADPIDREDADPIDPIDPIDRKDADPIDPIDLIDRKDEFCYATCDEVMELVDVDMPINDLKEEEGVKLDAAGTIVDGGPSRTSTDNI